MLWLYFLALLSLSMSPNLMRLTGMPPEVVGFLRMGVTSLALGVWTAIFDLTLKRKNSGPSPVLPSSAGAPLLATPEASPLGTSGVSSEGAVSDSGVGQTRWLWLWPVAAGFFFFLHLYTYKFAAVHTRIANTMILFAMNPLWMALLSNFWLKQKFPRFGLLSYLLSFLGLLVLMFQGLSLEHDLMQGNLAALISGFFYSCYLALTYQSRKHFHTHHFGLALFSSCAAFFLLLSVAMGRELFEYPVKGYAAILGLVVFPTFLGHFMFAYLVKFFKINWMSLGKLAEPGLATIFAWILFREEVPPTTWVAFLFIWSGVATLIVFREKTPSPSSAPKSSNI